MKHCNKCNLNKEDEEFAFKCKTKGTRASQCKACQKIFNANHHVQNRDHIRSLKKERWNNIKIEYRKWLTEQFKDKKCIDCGESDTIVLQFDHKRDKDFNIGDFLSISRGRALPQLIKAVSKEMEKCDIVCANCHTRRTAKSQGWNK